MLNKDCKKKFTLRLEQPNFWNKPDPAADPQWAREASVSAPCPHDQEPSHAKAFWLLDGPPYANGEVHLGHLLNKSLKDAFVRFHVRQGQVPTWRAGWDCHGLPLELATQKRPGAPHKSDPSFLGACRTEASFWMGKQKDAFARLGTLADLENPWTTMDPSREAKGMRLLLDLWKSGLLVERHSPTHWCPACQSALAASELEKTSASKDSLYAWTPFSKDSTPSLMARLFRTGVHATAELGLTYWTTTPWTLPGNRAFAFAENTTYCMVDLGGERMALCAFQAREKLEALFGRELPALGTFESSELDALGLRAMSPCSGESVPVASAPFATAADGTGFVHVAPAFGPEDFEWAESRQDLRVGMDCPMGPDGRYYPSTEAWSGLDLKQARSLVLETLVADGRALLASTSTEDANTCWRHGCQVFYRASRQWALDLDKPFEGAQNGLRGRALASLDHMAFYPNDKAKNALRHMLEGRRFWTMSRDRTWGLPLPMLRDQQGVLSSLTEAWWQNACKAVEQGGVEAYAAMEAPKGLVKENQCVDVWFDSGAAFETASEPGFDRPDLGVEGSDQTRGWFLSSMLLSAFRSEQPAFKALATHGFVVDEKGRKLSKSLGNAPDTQKLFDEHGSDALRLWALSQTMGQDVVWSKKSLEAAKSELRDWRNFLRYLLAHAQLSRQPTPQSDLDHLALKNMRVAMDGWARGFQAGSPQASLTALADFRRWASSTWFELAKRDLYCATNTSAELASKRALFGWTLQEFLSVLTPFMPLSCAHARAVAAQSFGELTSLDPTFSSHDALRAQEALEWRAEVHARLETEREQGGSFKAKYVLRDTKASLHAKSLGTECAHLVRGVSFEHENVGETDSGSKPGFELRQGWECPRCRGLFANAEQAGHNMDSDKTPETGLLARFQQRAFADFNAELCLKCLHEEYGSEYHA